jgi:hypothetical protein
MASIDRALPAALRADLPDAPPVRLDSDWPGDSGNRAALFRLRGLRPDGTVRSFILKRAARREVHVQQLIARTLPGAVPDVLAAWPAGPGSYFMLMDDIAGAVRPVAGPNTAGRPAAARSGPFHAALCRLAAIHDHFLDSTGELQRCGLTEGALDVPELCRQAQSMAGAVSLCGRLFDLPLDPRSLGDIPRIAACLPEAVAPLQAPGRRTLVHGDFHLENIVVDRADRARIIDWGSASIGVPAWDLVACGEAEIAWYLDARAALQLRPDPDGLFFDQLRASVICRMVQLLSAAMRSLLEHGPGIGAAIIPVCVERLVEAWSEPAFRGGRGIRLVESNSESRI